MNKLKKLIGLTLASSLVLTACSTGSTSGISRNEQEEIVKKFYTNFSGATGFKAKTETKVTVADNPSASSNMTLKIESPTLKGTSDVEIKGHVEISAESGGTALNDEINFVQKDNISYLNVPSMTSGTWVKTSDSEIKTNFTDLKGMSELFEVAELFKENSNKISVEEVNGKYKISYKEIDDPARVILIKNFDTNAQELSFFEEYEMKLDGNITFIVNKETLQPESLEITTASKDNTKEFSLKSNSTFSDINKISEITLPEGAKYAIDGDKLETME